MALNAYAQVTLNGTAIDGDVTSTEFGGVDVSSGHIEVVEFSFGMSTPLDQAAGMARTGRRVYSPLVLRKRIDRATPLLYQALVQNQVVTGGLKVFDTNPDDGTTQHRFTYAFGQARVSAIEDVSPSVFDNVAVPALERVTLTLNDITITDEMTGTQFADDIAIR